MIISLLVDLNSTPAVTGIVEPESHRLFRDTPCIPRELTQGRVSGFIKGHRLTANDPADNEENAVRLAEQLVRDAFRRHREKNKEKS